MNDPEVMDPPEISFAEPPANKFHREQQAFRAMLPELLQTHAGKYVAIHDGKVVDSGDDQITVALRAYASYGYIPIYVALVTDTPPIIRVPHRREMR